MTYDELVAIDLVSVQCGELQKYLSDTFFHRAGRELKHWMSLEHPMQSPLEATFWLWWQAAQFACEITPDVCLKPQLEATTKDGETYRLDFAVVPSYDREQNMIKWGCDIPKIAVELDGHDFHERTREQVIHRNKRDRALQADGWLVLHYSGSELVRDPYGVIHDCHSKADDLIYARQVAEK
jgi:hypothetical protein